MVITSKRAKMVLTFTVASIKLFISIIALSLLRLAYDYQMLRRYKIEHYYYYLYSMVSAFKLIPIAIYRKTTKHKILSDILCFSRFVFVI